MATYTAKINGKEHTFLKMTKAQCSAVIHAINAAKKVETSWIELTGVIGGEEHRSHLSVMFGSKGEGTLADPDKYASDLAALLGELPQTFTKENAGRFITWAEEIYREHLPTVDKRETPEQRHARTTEQNAKWANDRKEREATARAFAAKYADSPDPLPTPEGMQAVTIELNYNDSDSMTDYFDRHHSHGETMVLGYLPKGAKQTEAHARAMVAKYPELQGLTWTWNKENYSMGHGYWLESGVVGEAENVRTYGGYDNPPVWWEIKLDGGYHKALLPFRGFAHANDPKAPKTPPAPAPQSPEPKPAPEETPAAGYTVTYDRDWTWIQFPAKPAESVLAALHAAGGRWSRRRSAWYFTRHIESGEVSAIVGSAAPAPSDPAPVSDVLIPTEIWLSNEVPALEVA